MGSRTSTGSSRRAFENKRALRAHSSKKIEYVFIHVGRFLNMQPATKSYEGHHGSVSWPREIPPRRSTMEPKQRSKSYEELGNPRGMRLESRTSVTLEG